MKLGFPNIAYFVKEYKKTYERVENDAPNLSKEHIQAHVDFLLQKEVRLMCHIKRVIEPVIEEEFPELVADKVDNKWFLTIRPRDELNIIHFKKFVDELFQKRIFKNARWVYEQNGTSENEMGKGKHIHAICEMNSSNKGKKYFLGQIQNFIKSKGLGDYIYDNCVDFKKITTDRDLHYKNEYIRTDRFCKSTEEKEDSWKFNEPWRTANGIERSYDTNVATTT